MPAEVKAGRTVAPRALAEATAVEWAAEAAGNRAAPEAVTSAGDSMAEGIREATLAKEEDTAVTAGALVDEVEGPAARLAGPTAAPTAAAPEADAVASAGVRAAEDSAAAEPMALGADCTSKRPNLVSECSREWWFRLYL